MFCVAICTSKNSSASTSAACAEWSVILLIVFVVAAVAFIQIAFPSDYRPDEPIVYEIISPVGESAL